MLTPMREYATEQESFWAGEFGDAYADRNQGAERIAANTALFARILGSTRRVESVLEIGANTGLNLRALRALLPNADLAAVEINAAAAAGLRAWGQCDVHESIAARFLAERTYELTLAKGVLIHVDPQRLPDAYRLLAEASSHYVCVAEYYSPISVEVPYRGHSGRLFKRDFAAELMDTYGLELVDYGFTYHRDRNWPQDDITWFLLERA